jgi:hypothetical protein
MRKDERPRWNGTARRLQTHRSAEQAPRLDRPESTTRTFRPPSPKAPKRILFIPESRVCKCTWRRRQRNGERCKSWHCPSCRIWNSQQIAELGLALLSSAAADGIPARQIVLTCPRWERLSPSDFQRRIEALVRRLRTRKLLWTAYIAVWGLHTRDGRLHRHLLVVGGPFLYRGRIRPLLSEVGLGYADVRRVRNSARDRYRAADYLGRNALAFATHFPNEARNVNVFSRSQVRHG